MVKCNICGRNYSNYMRTFYVENKGEKTLVCNECRKETTYGKISYTNYIPTFVDGGDIVTKIFETKQELKDFILKDTDEEDIATLKIDTTVENFSKIVPEYTIIDVVKNEQDRWYVRGWVSCEIDLPKFEKK